jgi:hypothetical protein
MITFFAVRSFCFSYRYSIIKLDSPTHLAKWNATRTLTKWECHHTPSAQDYKIGMPRAAPHKITHLAKLSDHKLECSPTSHTSPNWNVTQAHTHTHTHTHTQTHTQTHTHCPPSLKSECRSVFVASFRRKVCVVGHRVESTPS